MELKLTTEQLNGIKKGYWIITRERVEKGNKVYINDELCGIVEIVEKLTVMNFNVYELVENWKVKTIDLITDKQKESMYSSSDVWLLKIEQFIWFEKPKSETVLAIAEPEISASPNGKKKSKKVKDNE